MFVKIYILQNTFQNCDKSSHAQTRKDFNFTFLKRDDLHRGKWRGCKEGFDLNIGVKGEA